MNTLVFQPFSKLLNTWLQFHRALCFCAAGRELGALLSSNFCDTPASNVLAKSNFCCPCFAPFPALTRYQGKASNTYDALSFPITLKSGRSAHHWSRSANMAHVWHSLRCQCASPVKFVCQFWRKIFASNFRFFAPPQQFFGALDVCVGFSWYLSTFWQSMVPIRHDLRCFIKVFRLILSTRNNKFGPKKFRLRGGDKFHRGRRLQRHWCRCFAAM